MRAALVCDEFYPDIGGAPHYAFELSLQLVKSGVEVVVITHGHPAQPEEEEIEGVNIRRLKGLVLSNPHRAASPLIFRHCHRYVLDGGFDVVHGLDVYSSMALIVTVFAHRQKIPCILTCHTVMGSDAAILWQRPLLGWSVKRADRIIAVSRAAAHFCRVLGVREARIAVVPNGVDLSCFNGAADASAIRGALGIGNEPVVMTASRLVKRKNPELLVSAFAKVLRAVPEARLVIAGSGREREKVSRQVDSLDIAGSVLMLGELPKEKVAQLMKASSVFVLSSKMESFGLSLLEASAAGVPVVCSNAGGIPEIFQDGFNAVLYPPGDDDAMAEAIISVIRDKDLAKKLSANAMRTADGFTWSIAAERTLRVYEEVVRQRGPARSHS